ncbi:MAG: endonuclease/exonuclease/phosphatase family protein [Prevotellaceae bacterium]|nr:endonuclease/exonuclease/phosphatase family protein [Prevotellaceae bacterium]
MKKLSLFFIFTLCLMALGSNAQRKFSVYAVGFYNQENLFDTCHDAGKRDYDFLPNGSYRWNGLKYSHKLHNMARALADMGTDKLPGIGCAVIGLSEVENAKVLDDLTAQEPLKERGYKYVHIEGPDRRGIDCALLYNPLLFKYKSSKLLPYTSVEEKDSAFHTRGFLTVDGTIADEPVTVIVCHWPSRASASSYRERAAFLVKNIKDSILNERPETKIMVMGDMNDDPTNTSMYDVLGAKAEIKDVQDGDMYNPWYNILKKQGLGTLTYQGSWNLFDQIVMTPNMIDLKGKKDYSTLKFFANQIFRRDYLFQTEGKYKGNPKRTHAGGVWLDGYSDHLPVVVYLVKEQK